MFTPAVGFEHRQRLEVTAQLARRLSAARKPPHNLTLRVEHAEASLGIAADIRNPAAAGGDQRSAAVEPDRHIAANRLDPASAVELVTHIGRLLNCFFLVHSHSLPQAPGVCNPTPRLI